MLFFALHVVIQTFSLLKIVVFTSVLYPFLGAANPTVARRNMTLPGENGQNLVEWRFRKEQTRGKVIVFGRKLRVSALYLKLSLNTEQ